MDLALANYDISWERSQLLDSLSPLIYSRWVMVYRKPQRDDEYRMPLGPLSSPVWIGLVVVFVWVSLHLWTMEVASAHLLERNQIVVSLGTGGCRILSKLCTVLFITGAAMLSERKLLYFV